MRPYRTPARPPALPRPIIGLIAGAVTVRFGLLVAALICVLANIDSDSFSVTGLFPATAGSSGVLPKDDPRVVLPRPVPPTVDPALTGAGYQCLTESTRPMRIVGCYRYRGGDWSDIRFRVVANKIVGFTLDGGSYDNGDGREFRQQAALIADAALDGRTARQVAAGVRRAIRNNGPVALDTTSAQQWSGTAEADADHWANEYSLRLNSTGDRDGVLPEPRVLPARSKEIGRRLAALGYDCDVYGSQRDCYDGWSPEESANDFTVIGNHRGISRLELSYEDQTALADYLKVVGDADPGDARLLTAAVLRTNDGHAHHLVINGLMVAVDVGRVAIYGIDWPI